MDLLSRRDLIKPHIAELRQQSRRAQAVRQPASRRQDNAGTRPAA
jgi:hypothetical protein